MPVFKLPDWKLSWKLPLTIAIPAVMLVTITSGLQLKQASLAIEQEHKTAYTSYVHEKGAALENWLTSSQTDVLALAESFGIKTALRGFSNAWVAYGGDVSADLRRLYISENPHPIGQKDELDQATDKSQWSAVHAFHHPGLRSFQRARGYYDLFLFDVSGNLVYSVFKEDDFGLNFNSGKYAKSGLGEVFQIGNNLNRGEFHLTDINPYAPSAGAPAMFLSTPVFDNGQKIGVVAVQLPMDTMNQILNDSEMLGATGEVYLVDNNGRALTASRHEGGHKPLDMLPELEQIRSALNGEDAHFEHATGINGHEVVAESYDVSTSNGEHWGLVFEIDRAEAMRFINKAIFTGIIELAITGVLLCLLAWFAVRSVIKRVEQIAREMEQIADQNYDEDIVGQNRTDEVGFISKTLANLQVHLRDGAEAQQREIVVQEQNKRVVELLTTALLKLAQGDFRDQILEHFPVEHKKLRYSINDAMNALSAVVASVRHTADSINQSAQEISGSADELSQRTESQAATLEQTVAALEEVTVSVHSATEHVENVERTVETARGKAEESGVVVNETIRAMTEIEQSSNQIKQIIGVIDDIAFQTNLLALNAGVEAARAGEAGRGFAVVASEVRGLAQRSADAALEIKTLIESSGRQVGKGVEMVGRTGEALNIIVDQVKDIATLVNEIAQSSREQSTALSEINTGMTQLDQVTQRNAAMVEENTAAAHILRGDADQLIVHVGQFKTNDSPPETTSSPTAVPVVSEQPTEVVDLPETKMVANEKWADF